MSVVNSEVPPSPSLRGASEEVNASETQLKFTPLHAEAAEKYARWFKLEMNRGCEGRAAFLCEQLKARPNPWGIGLWKDAETEKIAKRCAEIFIEFLDKCPNDRLIPQDSMTMVAALNDTGDMDDVFAVQDIEYEFGCRIPDNFYTDETTFGDFVECVKAGRGKVQPQTEKATAGGWLSSFGFVAFLFLSWVIIPGFAFYKLGVSIWSIINEGWSACPVKDLIQESIVVLICLGVWGMILWAVIKRRKGPDPRITKM